MKTRTTSYRVAGFWAETRVSIIRGRRANYNITTFEDGNMATSTSCQATTVSFQILSNSLSFNHSRLCSLSYGQRR
jgi:hypothetical protein